MVFTSVTFVFYFLPIFLLVYFLLPKRVIIKNLWILAASLFFYAWGEYTYVLVLFISICLNYVFGRLVSRNRNHFILATGVGLNLAILIYYKYFHFLFPSFFSVLEADHMPSIYLPLGISFFTFQGISYIVDVYREDAIVETNFVNLGMYIAMFPQLIAGPIVRFKTIQAQIRQRQVTWQMFGHGAFLFMMGVSYKVILANYLGEAVDIVFSNIDNGIGTVSAWLGIFSYSFQIYFDFCGYSVMAVGLGMMLGFTLPVNFRYPYIAKSITEFWRRWHITLSEWFRDYLYIPLGGSRGGRLTTYRNLWVVFLLCGLWHGAQWTFVVWGVYMGTLLVVERLGLKNVYDKLPRVIVAPLIFWLVSLGWTLFRSDDLSQALAYFELLFSYKPGMLNTYFIGEYFNLYGLIIMVSSVLLSTPLFARMIYKNDSDHVLCEKEFFDGMKHKVIVKAVVYGVFLIAVAIIADSSYQPFIYFRF